jgi:hypothetical protein
VKFTNQIAYFPVTLLIFWAKDEARDREDRDALNLSY